MTGEFPSQRASNVENTSIWWRHHVPTAADRTTNTIVICHNRMRAPFYINGIKPSCDEKVTDYGLKLIWLIKAELSATCATWNWVIIGQGNVLSLVRWQAINRTNDDSLSVGHLRTNFSEITDIQTFSLKKMHLETSSAKRRPLCLVLNALRQNIGCPGVYLSCLAQERTHIVARCRYTMHFYSSWLSSSSSAIVLKIKDSSHAEWSIQIVIERLSRRGTHNNNRAHGKLITHEYI